MKSAAKNRPEESSTKTSTARFHYSRFAVTKRGRIANSALGSLFAANAAHALALRSLVYNISYNARSVQCTKDIRPSFLIRQYKKQCCDLIYAKQWKSPRWSARNNKGSLFRRNGTDQKQDGNNRERLGRGGKGELRMWAPHKFVFALLLRLLRCKITAARRLHSIHSNFFTTPLLE